MDITNADHERFILEKLKMDKKSLKETIVDFWFHDQLVDTMIYIIIMFTDKIFLFVSHIFNVKYEIIINKTVMM